ncbi:hypothetical protein [Chlamydiifrater phoenicopteri]|uniref:hypothetical protein n=1 Tax=Chlamydiifrater phoenicopteri TaxID=2681469 RepID=UPI001BCDF2F7|nr:hypothetical protein [Chlamydiifrater phoenicopteri]
MKIFSNKTTNSAATESSSSPTTDSTKATTLGKRVLYLARKFFLEVLPKLAIISLVVLSACLAIAYCSVGTLVGAISLGYLMLSSAIAGVWITKKMHKNKGSEEAASAEPASSNS